MAGAAETTLSCRLPVHGLSAFNRTGYCRHEGHIVAPNQAKKPAEAAGEIMLVNDVPGEECRIAVLQDGRLEHLFTERAATATSVRGPPS